MRRCVISGCRELGEHLDDCNSERCKGCRPRATERGLVCNSDRTGLAAMLGDIWELDGQLREDEDPVDHRDDWTWRPVPTSDPSRRPGWRWAREGAPEDVLSRVLPMGIVKSSLGAGARVSGSKEPAAPTDLDRLDMAAPVRPALLTRQGWAAIEDQIGNHTAAAPLYGWARVWWEDMFADEQLPRPTVPALVRWLGDRLDKACNEHPAIDEFAADIRDERAILRGKLGLNEPPRELCDGVECKVCDRKALYREGGLISCVYCGHNYSEAEYKAWIGLLVAPLKRAA